MTRTLTYTSTPFDIRVGFYLFSIDKEEEERKRKRKRSRTSNYRDRMCNSHITHKLTETKKDMHTHTTQIHTQKSNKLQSRQMYVVCM